MTEAIVWLVLWALAIFTLPSLVAFLGNLGVMGGMALWDEAPVYGVLAVVLGVLLWAAALGVLVLTIVQTIMQVIDVVTLASA